MLEPLVLLMNWFGACSARISGDRQTHTQTHRMTTVTLTAHARRGYACCADKADERSNISCIVL